MATTTSFTTIWWSGGTEYGQWNRCEAVATRAEADAQAEEIRHGGRKAIAGTTHGWDTIGLPDGYEARGILHDRCQICHQPQTARHGHPHDFVGADLTAACLACNQQH